MIISFATTDKNQALDNTDNTYTSFKDFSLVGIWKEKSQIITIINIK